MSQLRLGDKVRIQRLDTEIGEIERVVVREAALHSRVDHQLWLQQRIQLELGLMTL